MENRDTGDFAIVGIHQGSVLLEANEWDARTERHWVVTLYLAPEQALHLAEKLSLCATHMQQESGFSN